MPRVKKRQLYIETRFGRAAEACSFLLPLARLLTLGFPRLAAVAALPGQRVTLLPFSSSCVSSTKAPAAPALLRVWSGGNSRELSWSQ